MKKLLIISIMCSMILLSVGCGNAGETSSQLSSDSKTNDTISHADETSSQGGIQVDSTPTMGETTVDTDDEETTADAIFVFNEALGIEDRDGCTYVNGILIANKTYALPDDFSPGINDTAQAALEEMQMAAAAEDIILYPISDFRPYSSQERIYNGYVDDDGKENADRYSARPGHSEHQTGLAFDLNSLEESFGETAEGIWLKEHCAEYGFIIRYPSEKEELTGYMYEPWHVRYLGKALAEDVENSGLCLEEYLDIDSKYAD